MSKSTSQTSTSKQDKWKINKDGHKPLTDSPKAMALRRFKENKATGKPTVEDLKELEQEAKSKIDKKKAKKK